MTKLTNFSSQTAARKKSYYKYKREQEKSRTSQTKKKKEKERNVNKIHAKRTPRLRRPPAPLPLPPSSRRNLTKSGKRAKEEGEENPAATARSPRAAPGGGVRSGSLDRADPDRGHQIRPARVPAPSAQAALDPAARPPHPPPWYGRWYEVLSDLSVVQAHLWLCYFFLVVVVCGVDCVI